MITAELALMAHHEQKQFCLHPTDLPTHAGRGGNSLLPLAITMGAWP